MLAHWTASFSQHHHFVSTRPWTHSNVALPAMWLLKAILRCQSSHSCQGSFFHAHPHASLFLVGCHRLATCKLQILLLPPWSTEKKICCCKQYIHCSKLPWKSLARVCLVLSGTWHSDFRCFSHHKTHCHRWKAAWLALDSYLIAYWETWSCSLIKKLITVHLHFIFYNPGGGEGWGDD